MVCVKSVYVGSAFSAGIFKYDNDIHTTANDVTKGLIGPC